MKPAVLCSLLATIALVSACGGEPAPADPVPADPASCGNGTLDSGEACDGPQLGGSTCEALGLGAGSLRCSAACTLDRTGCSAHATCGNGALDSGESCDGAQVGRATCTSLGFESGALACNERCTGFDTGRITLAGQPPTEDDTCVDNAAVISVDSRGIAVPCGSGFTFGPQRFVPGTYSAFVSAGSSTNLPSSSAAFVVPPAGGAVVVDLLPSRQLTLRFTVNGAAPTDCVSGEAARLTVRSSGFTSSRPIPCGAGFEATLSVPAGEYQISTGPALNGSFPIYVHPTPIDVQMDRTVLIDIVTRSVSGQILRNGVAPVETAACVAGETVAEVLFFDARSGSPTPLAAPVACGAGFAYGPVELAVGVYAIHVRPVGTPPRSDLPPYQYLAVPRFLVE